MDLRQTDIAVRDVKGDSGFEGFRGSQKKGLRDSGIKNKAVAKSRFKFHALAVCAALMTFATTGWGQSFLGLDGGLEGSATVDSTFSATAPSAGNGKWTTAGSSASQSAIAVETSTVRSGAKSLKISGTSTTLARIWTPCFTIASTTSKFFVQYYRYSASTANTQTQQPGNVRGGTEQASGTYTTVTSASTWEKITYAPTTVTAATSVAGAILNKALGTGGTMFVDDFVIYADTTADNTAPSAPTLPSITPASGQITVSWTAASGGVDNGGYMVVRGTADPTTAPNVNGVYAVGNTVASGQSVVYVGTNTSFADTGLTNGTNYYYRIYTFDKAYNYSSAVTASGAPAAPTPTIAASGTLTAVNTTYGTASASPTSFTVSGSNLTGNLTVAPPSGFEVSTTIGSGYTTSLTLTATTGSVASTTVYVRLAATATAGSSPYSGNITVSGGGATSQNVATVSSTVSKKALTITAAAQTVSYGTAAATVTGAGSYTPTGFANGDTSSVIGGTASYTTTYTATTAAGSNVATITPITTSLTATNYSFTAANGNITVTAVVPSAPTITGITAGNGQLSVDFTAPSSNGGASLTNYEYSTDGGTTWITPSAAVTSSPLLITGLANATAYNVQLRAKNSVGSGTATASTQATPVAPSSPTLTVAPATFGSAFSTTYGTASSTQTFTVSGSTLSGDVTVTAPTGFEISLSSGTGYAGSLVLAQTSGSVASTTIYAQLKATAAAGSYNGQTFTVVSTGATTQNVATTASGNVVGQAALTITGIGIANKVYDRSTTATITGTATYGGLQNGESFSVTGTPSASFATATVGLAKPVTVLGYTAPNSNYTLTQPTPAADISAVTLTVTGATVTPKSYDGNTVATITGATLSGVISPDVVTLTGGTSGTFANANVGTGIAVSTTMGITGADAGNYSFTAPTGLVGEITKATATITFTSLPSGKKVGDAAFSAGATTTAGILSYSSSNPNVATVDGSGNITPVAPGVTTITANVAGTANYNAAAPASQTLNVAGTAPSLTVLSENFASLTAGNDTSTTGQSSALSGTSLANFPTVSSAYSAGGAVKLGVSGGTGSITSKTLDLSGNGGNYTVTFKVKGWTTVEGSIIVTPSVGSSQTVSYTAVMGGSYETKTLAFTGGTSSMTLSFATSAKRAFLDDIVVTTAGASTPAITPSGSFSALTTTYGAASGASATTVKVTGGSLTADILATAPTGFEVSNDGATYGATATYIQTGGFANGTLYLRLAANAAAGSRSGDVVLSSTGATQVNVPVVASTVTAKALSVTADAKSMIYGSADPALSYTSDGLVNGDALSGSLSRAVGTAVGTYAISQGTLANPNYNISFTGANFTITAASLASSAITLTPQSDGSYAASGPAGSTFNYSYAGRSANGITTSYNSARAPTAAGYYTVSATATGNYSGSNTADYFVAGPVAVADSRTKSAGNTAQMIPISDLLGNVRRITSTGTVETTGLTVTGVTSGSGNNAEIAGVFIKFTPSSASTDTFTYTVTDGTKTATATVTITTETQAPSFDLQIVKVGAATFGGSNTTITHDFIGVPNQTYLVEYATNLEGPWISAGNQSTGPTGSFSVNFTTSGDVAADWNAHMFFRARLVP